MTLGSAERSRKHERSATRVGRWPLNAKRIAFRWASEVLTERLCSLPFSSCRGYEPQLDGLDSHCRA